MSTDLPALPRVDPDVEQSRESAARLLNALARALRRNRAVQNAANGVGRAARYVRASSAGDMAAGLGRLTRRKPAVALSLAIAAGFLMGATLGRKVFR
jgi:hypothetical protein